MSEGIRYSLILLFWVVCGIWIYTDAKSRNLKDAFSWAFLGVFLGILGVLGYFIFVIKPDKRGA